MSFLLPIFSSIVSNPLVQGLVGNLATGAISTIKDTASNLLGTALERITGKKEELQQKIDNYQLPKYFRGVPPPDELEAPRRRSDVKMEIEPDERMEYGRGQPYSPPRSSVRTSYGKRGRPPPIYTDENDWEDIEPPPRKRVRQNPRSRSRRSGRVPYDPDMISEYE